MTEPTPNLRQLYPDFTEDELATAEFNLECYLALVLQIFERLESEGRLPEIKKLPEK